MLLPVYDASWRNQDSGTSGQDSDVIWEDAPTLANWVTAVVVLVVSSSALGAATGSRPSALPKQAAPPAQAAAPAPAGAPAVHLETSVSEASRAVETLRRWKFKSPVTSVRVTVEAARRDLEPEFNAASTQQATALRIGAMRVAGLIAEDTDAGDDELAQIEAAFRDLPRSREQ